MLTFYHVRFLSFLFSLLTCQVNNILSTESLDECNFHIAFYNYLWLCFGSVWFVFFKIMYMFWLGLGSLKMLITEWGELPLCPYLYVCVHIKCNSNNRPCRRQNHIWPQMTSVPMGLLPPTGMVVNAMLEISISAFKCQPKHRKRLQRDKYTWRKTC